MQHSKWWTYPLGARLRGLPGAKKARQAGASTATIDLPGRTRAACTSPEPWLARMSSPAAWIATAFLSYFAWPGRSGRSTQS
jgi:hypothetical protein